MNLRASLGASQEMMKCEAANVRKDAYFSADVETDGPIPGPYSMLSFALVFAGIYDGKKFYRPKNFKSVFYAELQPISEEYQEDALSVNKLDRNKLMLSGKKPETAMRDASDWVKSTSGDATPVLAAYPLSFDWTWLYWYFERFLDEKSPFNHSRCFDIKTAISTISGIPISEASRKTLPPEFRSNFEHSHHAVHDATEQADILAKIFEYRERLSSWSELDRK